jgi:type IV pilus assembly protein PilC
VALLRAGARSGRLADFLTQFLVQYRKARLLERRAWLNLLYPLLLLVAAAMITVFATFWVVPSFKEIFEDFGVQLPAVTVLIITISDLLVNYTAPVLAAAAVVCVALWLGLRFFSGTAGWRRFWFGVPLMGTAFKSSTMAWFTHLLALLTENNVPLPEALLLAADGTGDPLLRESCRRLVAASVARGEPFALVAHEIPVFPAMFVQTLSLEHQRNTLPAGLRALAEIFERQAEVRGGLAAVMLAPIVLGGFLFLVGFVVLAMFMPLVSLLNELS